MEKSIRLRGAQQVSIGTNILNLLNANYINPASTSDAAPSGSAQVVQQSGRNFGPPAAGGVGVSAAVAWPRLAELVIKYSF